MTDSSPNLKLPFILPAQAQKHVTHNEALLALDTLVDLTVTDELAEPPPMVAEGDAYLVSQSAGGAWLGKEGLIASRQDGSWNFYLPRTGTRAWFVQQDEMRVFTSGEWRPLIGGEGAFDAIGVGAQPDSTNRLAIASPASLSIMQEADISSRSTRQPLATPLPFCSRRISRVGRKSALPATTRFR